MAPGACKVVAVGSSRAGSRHESHDLSCSTVVTSSMVYRYVFIIFDFFDFFFLPLGFRILRDGSSEILRGRSGCPKGSS